MASLSQGRTAAAQCGLFTYKSVLVIYEPPCVYFYSKWKPSITPQGASSLYHLIRMESFSVYLNPSCGACGLVTGLVDAGSTPYCWRNEMKKGLETFSINKEDFDFSKCFCHHFTVPVCTSCFNQSLSS